jgi:hypothetical protein
MYIITRNILRHVGDIGYADDAAFHDLKSGPTTYFNVYVDI